MKTIHRFLLAWTVVLGALLNIGAQAQSYSPVTVSGLPANIVTGTTSNILTSVYVGNREYLAAALTYDGSTNTQNITITMDYSVDGSSFVTSPTASWVFALSGTTGTLTTGTNLNVGGWGWVRFKTIAFGTGGSTNVTLTSLKVGDKILTRR